MVGVCVGSVSVVFGAAALLRGGAEPRRPASPAIQLDPDGERRYQTLVTRVGGAVTFAAHDVVNTSAHPVELLDYRPVSVPRGIELLGTGVYGEGRPYSFGGDIGFPPQDENLKPHFRPLEGHLVDPYRRDRGERGTQLLIGFRALRRGFFPMRAGMRLVYRQEGRRTTAESTFSLGVSAISAREYRRKGYDPFAQGGLCDVNLLSTE